MEYESNQPWWLINGKIDEELFCKWFLNGRKMKCVNGTFFTEEGRLRDLNALKAEIYHEIKFYAGNNILKRVESILGALRMECNCPTLENSDQVIHVANGTYHLEEGFSPEKRVCRHRLPVNYMPHSPEPERWLRFLNELLEPEDIETLQEYMGYCLIPTTKAQKMLLLIGNGGEGKSRVGMMMRHLLGDSMHVGSIDKVENNPFARADLEHILLFVDDDLRLEALKNTNHIKAIVSAEQPMDLEKKGEQSYQGQLYSRFMCFGNGNLQALHDRSYGFFRRQIILSVKPRDPDRIDNPYLSDELGEELESIFIWCLHGLYRLLLNEYRFTLSEKSKANMNEAISEGNNIIDFMISQGYISFEPEACATTKALYSTYKDWCMDNIVVPLGPKSFSAYLKWNWHTYNIRYDESLPIGNGKRARGYRGIRVQHRI